jgi:hypothetical protein
MMPEKKMVYVFLMNTDEEFVDPGPASIQLAAMIMNAQMPD